MKIIKDIKLRELMPFLDRKWLYNGLWKLGGKPGGDEILSNVILHIEELDPSAAIIWDCFDADYDNNKLCVKQNNEEVAEFNIKRELLWKIIGKKKVIERIALLATTVGDSIINEARRRQKKDEYSTYFYLHGFSAALAEAATEYGHHNICKALGTEYAATFRISPGYSVWNDLNDQKVISKLIPMDEIGIRLTDTNQLVPEHSTTSMVGGFCRTDI